MLNKENIICISSIDWDFVWQGHQEIMSTFAKNGNRVLFIENTGVRMPTFKDIPRLKKRISNWLKGVKGFRKEAENLFVYSPIALPFPYSKIARWINKRLLLEPLKKWANATGFHEPIMWTFLPTGIALDILNELDYKLLVYYYIANFDLLSDNSKKLKETEDALIRKCDLIFAQGHVLADKCKRLNSKVFIFPFGVNTDIFEKFLNSGTKPVPEELKEARRPLIVYVGGLHKHVDLHLLRHVAQNCPECSVVLIGPRQVDVSSIENLPNVMLLGQKPFSELPSYISNSDVCIIPYVSSEYTKTVYPTKLNEYHIMGKPVVSTYLPEVEVFNSINDNLVAVARSPDEFVERIKEAIASDSQELAQMRMQSAKKNSWNDRITGMSALMEKAMEEKRLIPLNWQAKFLKLYKSSRKNVLKTAGAAILLWFLIFYTPIVWFIAEPLKITQDPQKADAIVVLAGGVGESGKAGQGYEERVGYALELYKKGYADYLIFSSGFKYFFDETLLMKALAVALGVPENAIILEDRAKNTYENMEFTKEILAKKKWNKALLVSSPYHMLRVSLVADKIAKDIQFVYTPMPISAFYSHQQKKIFARQITFRQIRGIFHEYMGIVYYWWKRWI